MTVKSLFRSVRDLGGGGVLKTSQSARHPWARGREGAGLRGGHGQEAPGSPEARAGATTGLRKGAWGAENVRERRALRQRHFILAREPSLFAEARPPPLNPAGPASPGGFAEHGGRGTVGKRSLEEDRERLRPEPRRVHSPRGARPSPAAPHPLARAHRLGSAPRAAATGDPRGCGQERRPCRAAVSPSHGGQGGRRGRGSPGSAWPRPRGMGLGSRALTLRSSRPTASSSLACSGVGFSPVYNVVF